MDPVSREPLDHNVEDKELQNEKKKKMDPNANQDVDVSLTATYRQMSNLPDDERNCNSDSSSGDSDDLINTINYNTIASLAALKDILQGDGSDTHETDSFFQHYFMNHCNNLSSRNSVSPFPFTERRRLSQCREEDEDDEKKDNDGNLSDATDKSVSSDAALFPSVAELVAVEPPEPVQHESVDNDETINDEESINYDDTINDEATKEQSGKRTVMGAKHKFLVTPTSPPQPPPALEYVLRNKSNNAHTVHFGTKGAEEARPSLRSIFEGQNLHRDKKYFDSSLIEIRSSVDNDSLNSEDIWIKRNDDKKQKLKDDALTVSGKPSPEILKRRVSLDDNGGRPRAGTWGSQSSKKEKDSFTKESRKDLGKKDSDDRRKQRDKRLDAAITRSTQSVGERRRRGSADDGVGYPLYQQTIHGTSGVSRRPALFDIFKSGKKYNDPKKQPSIMQQVKTAMQSKKPVAVKEVSKEALVKTRDGSAHPHAGSDVKYYHTVTATRRPSAMAKVMDIFRGRPSATTQNAPQDAADRRKARALAQQQQINAGANLRRAASQEAEKRRSSLGNVPVARHRASDAFLDPHHAAILFRDSRGLPVADPFLEKVNLSDLEEDESQIFVKFFKFHKCYDLIPTSAKLVVFDTQLLVKKAFFALVYNGVRAAPLWDSQRHKFVGMLTITDFIKILQMYYTSANVAMDKLEEHRLETWRHVLSAMPLVSIGPDSSLYEAIRMLITNRIHRLPVIDPDTGNVLYILTHKRILRFLFLYINELPKPKYLQCKVRDLQIGTLHNVETATEETSIIEALRKFVNRRVSALPIVDSEGRLKNIYAKFDVINLAAEKTYNNLDVSLKTANEHRNEWFEGVQKCTLDETLYDVMERIVRAEVHRLVVVNEEEKVIGIISLSDLLLYLVLRPTGECGTTLRTEMPAVIDEDDERKVQALESQDSTQETVNSD